MRTTDEAMKRCQPRAPKNQLGPTCGGPVVDTNDQRCAMFLAQTAIMSWLGVAHFAEDNLATEDVVFTWKTTRIRLTKSRKTTPKNVTMSCHQDQNEHVSGFFHACFVFASFFSQMMDGTARDGIVDTDFLDAPARVLP